jgi:hypothetical protein
MRLSYSDAEFDALAKSLGLEAVMRVDPLLFRQVATRMTLTPSRTTVVPTTEPAHVFVAAVGR